MTARLGRLVRPLLLAAAPMVCAGASLAAQQPRTGIAPEVRADVLGGRGVSVQAGAGIQIPAGTYVRVGVIGGVGSSREQGQTRTDGRLDVLARFLIDPFRQSRWGMSAGAGVSLRARDGDRVRPNVLLAADLEGPRSRSGVSPAFQIGFGGGVRGGVGLRWGGRSAR